MRSLIAVAAMVMLVPAPALAQMGGGRHHQGEDRRAEPKKPQVDEKAYKAALDRIPEPKDKYDPWGVARPSQPDKSKAK